MSDPQLQQHIQSLGERLAELDQLDPDDRQALRACVERIVVGLEADEPGATEILAEQLGEACVRFREQHPALASGLRRLADILNQTGL
ncbi:MAG: DUF4404 family protein [Planctomycetota bacterium]|jgi:hypothetical protein